MRIDVFQDTVCPWCRIGKAHLKTALAGWDGEPAEVHYRAYFLNPDMPPEGRPFREHLLAKGGGRIPLEQWFGAPREAGRHAGLVFNFEQIERAPNTLLSHQLIALTPDELKEAMIDAIYDAYFEQGQDIGNLTVLAGIAAAQGLDADTIHKRLSAGEGREAVLADVMQAQRFGIGGVPFFVFNNRLAISGAYPPDVFLQVLQKASVAGV